LAPIASVSGFWTGISAKAALTATVAKHQGGGSYQVILNMRKCLEESFGWIMAVGGVRPSCYRELNRTQVLRLLRGGELQAVAHGAVHRGLKRRERAGKTPRAPRVRRSARPAAIFRPWL